MFAKIATCLIATMRISELLAQPQVVKCDNNEKIINARVQSPVVGMKYHNDRKNLVVFENEKALTYRITIEDGQGISIHSFILAPKMLYAVKDYINQSNYQTIKLKVVYDSTAYKIDVERLNLTRENIEKIRNFYYRINWAIREALNRSKGSDATYYLSKLLNIFTERYHEVVSVAVENNYSFEERENLVNDIQSLLNFSDFLALFKPKEITEIKAAVAIINELSGLLTTRYYENQLNNLARQVRVAQNEYNRGAEYCYTFPYIARDTANFYNTMPNYLLTVGLVSINGGISGWGNVGGPENKTGFVIASPLKLNRTLLDVFSTKNNIFRIGAAASYEHSNKMYNSSLSTEEYIDLVSLRAGLTLNFFVRTRAMFGSWGWSEKLLTVVTLEGGMAKISPSINISSLNEESKIFNLPETAPYIDLSFQWVFAMDGPQPRSAWGLSIGFQLTRLNWRFAEGVNNQSYTLPEYLLRAQWISLTYIFR